MKYEKENPTPPIRMIISAKDSIMKIKDLSSIKCHKEMKNTWFS